MRTVPLYKFQPPANIHDIQTHSTFSKFLYLDDITARSWAQAILSIRHGGFGLTSIQNLSPIAFVVGWFQYLHVLPSWFSGLRRLVDTVLSQAISLNAQIDTISYKLQKSLNPGQTVTDLLPDIENLQHRL